MSPPPAEALALALEHATLPDDESGPSLPPDAPTREQRRSRRKRAVRARTISVKRMTKRELELGRLMNPGQPGVDYQRPETRAECIDGPRPCPFVSCVHHLYLDVMEDTGAIKLNFPDLEVEDMVESCSLDVADRGGATLEEVGAILNLTRERIRQIEVRALKRVQTRERGMLSEHVPLGASKPVRRLPVLRNTPRALGFDPADLEEQGDEEGEDTDG